MKLFGWVPASELGDERIERIKARMDYEVEHADNKRLRDQVASLERQADHLRQALDRERHLSERATEAHQNLVTLIVEMKREGFVPAPHGDPGNLEKLDFGLPGVIQDAIELQSAGDPSLERKLTKWALGEMRQESPDAQKIAAQIKRGGTSEEEEED